MIAAGSLQLFHELGTCKQYGVLGHPNQSKRSMIRTSRLHLLRPALSSHALLQDAWALHLSDTLHRPIHCFPSRYNIFVCRSFLTPGRANEAPILKAATLALTRSYKYLNGTPLVLQLVPAVGIIAFAVWGLGPLMRHSRNLFLHRSDSSWKKSRTYRVFTSYLQPFLLWTGATLICRVLDPVTLPSEASQAIKQRLLNFVKSLSTVLAFAYCLSSLIQQAQKFFMETNDSNDARNMGFQFAGKAVYTAVWVAAVSLFMELLGFSTQRWLTAGGLGTVLLTLAGREIFTNFLSSVMIHATRPFIVNEWIQTKIEGYEVSGTVEEAILLDLLRVVSHHRARLATPIRTVQKIYADADVDNIPFSETIFTRAGAATPRPLLLIEPPSRIHSDDRTTKARSPRANEEQVAKAVVLDSKETGSATDTSAQHASDNRQSKKAGSGDARSKSGKVEGAPSVVPASPPLPKQQLEGLDSIGEKTDSLPSTYHVKHESERSPPTPPTPPIARPALEENIVLGVALEGSKRTLPIEEGMGPTLNPAEAKELATCRNGNGSSSATAGKDKKDNQLPAVPGTASSDQRDQER
ncbi:mechanosensitive ion channel protein 2, chloroplastic-like isoform X3 [Magnolia sinica]|uniref:mechanosensitive ion channel protein 2, chloroplastic-like isoform X3 n=1 Tax=Magnolia sinica TaxID=86752 RepID=UPI002659BBA6|nr:mechanosensitive ion channel protein 2, chloroplastic-like isoform X3 [Magnolia sinica]